MTRQPVPPDDAMNPRFERPYRCQTYERVLETDSIFGMYSIYRASSLSRSQRAALETWDLVHTALHAFRNEPKRLSAQKEVNARFRKSGWGR